MSKHWVEVKQLNVGDVYLNVEAEDNAGFIEVWGSTYLKPTYLLRDKTIGFVLICFENMAYAREWFKEYKPEQYWPYVWQLTEDGKIVSVNPDNL